MEHIWNLVKAIVQDKVDKDNYSIWIMTLEYESSDDNFINLKAPNLFSATYIRENFSAVLNESISEAGYPELNFKFSNFIDSEDPPKKKNEAITSDEDFSSESTFDNFVVGNCNKFAHAAALAVSERLGDKQYNPLFIYGSTGLGKTHLLNAIANSIQDSNEGVKTRYVTAEQFTNELIYSFRHRTYEDFQLKYRDNTHLLLIDDIQFFSGKERTQEELFHTFEYLTNKSQQIVFTADVLPKDINGLEPRLRTRFQSGMIIDMQPPDLETLTAIVFQESEELGMRIDSQIALYIASGVSGNIRELKGVLYRLNAMSKFSNVVPTLAFAKENISQILSHNETVASPEEIIEAVSNVYLVRISDIKGKGRQKKFVRPRHISMYLVREITNLSFPDIAKIFGNRDQSTIQHGCKRIQQELQKDPNIQSRLLLIKRNLS